MKRFNPFFSISTLLLTLTFCGCGGSSSTGTTGTTSPTIYVAGYQGASSGGWPYTPDYWTNTQGTVANPLSVGSGMNDSEAVSIVISGNDVYIAGYVGSMTSDSNAAYWKNGSVNILPDPNPPSQIIAYQSVANSIVVSGNDVYVAGSTMDTTTTNSLPVYWKNGVPTLLSKSNWAGSSGANSIAVSGNDVYTAISGMVFASNITNYYWQAEYLKNGTVIVLPNPSGTDEAQADSIVVSGSDVYIAGVASDSTTGNSVNLYWKNGTPVVLSNPSGTSTEMFTVFANSIAVSGSNVYVVGTVHENTTGTELPVFWQNGTATILPNPGGLNWANANSIVVSGTDVYIAGEEYDNTGVGSNSKACYWKNGGPAIVLSDGKYEAWGTAIAVQE
jgi:hypothetical protein